LFSGNLQNTCLLCVFARASVGLFRRAVLYKNAVSSRRDVLCRSSAADLVSRIVGGLGEHSIPRSMVHIGAHVSTWGPSEGPRAARIPDPVTHRCQGNLCVRDWDILPRRLAGIPVAAGPNVVLALSTSLFSRPSDSLASTALMPITVQIGATASLGLFRLLRYASRTTST
jgi:hypothetical protein